MAVKKRVFQVAREFNIANEALIEFLKKLDYDIRNHMSPVDDDAYALVQEKFGEKPAQVDEEYEFRKRLRDRKAQEEASKEKAKEDLERRIRVSQELAQEIPKLKRQRGQEKEIVDVPEQPDLVTEPVAEESQVDEARAEVTEAVGEKPEKIIEKTQVPSVEELDEEAPAKKKSARKKLRIVEIPSEDSGRKLKEDHKKVPPAQEKGEETKETEKTAPVKKEEKEESRSKRKRKRKRPAAEEDDSEAEELLVPSKKHKKKKKKKKKPQFDEEEIKETIRQTLASIDDSGKTKKRKRRTQVEETDEEEQSIIRVSEFMSLSELAKLMEVESSELIKKCMELGMMVSINQRIDMDTITLLASEYEFQVEALEEFGEELVEELEEDDEGTKLPRPPVVTIMGHVDHGKTSLLDYIRSSNIIAGEAGGITQHIGAYEVEVNGKSICFLDTPGHEAFTAMRARGAQVTDIVVLIVAADDSVMPQTIEAISHAKAANVPIVVAINKIDKPSANSDMIRKQLAEHDVLVEQWGGKYQSVEVSAKTGQGMEQLLELILLEAELLDLRANPDRNARGVVIESRLDRGKGVVSTVLVQAGTLRVGQPFVAGATFGKVRSMLDERSHSIKLAGPSVPVQVLGFDSLPQSGDSFVVLDSERDTKEISQKRQQLQREHEHWQSRPRTLDQISKQIQKGKIKQLSVVLKADVDGSIEAITDSLQKLATDEVAVNVILRGVGAISETDVILAAASSAIIIGFHVRPATKARELAAKEQVDIRLYDVIYDIISDVKSALEGFLSPTLHEEIVGTIEVRETFKVPKIGTIAGCYVLSGKINRNDKIKLYRDDRLVHDGKISSLKRFKDDAKEVAAGFECGIGIDRYDDIKVNDVIEVYNIIETKRSL